jgi:hypothetical protein
MLKSVIPNSKVFTAGLLTVAIAAAISGCSRGSTEEVSATDVRATELETRLARLEQREAQLAAKEQEQKEQELKAQEQERAREEAAIAAREREAAAKAAEAKKARSAPTRVASINPPAPPKAPPRPQPIDVPAGTQLTLALSSDLSTKTLKPGDAVEARLASDLVIDGRRAAPAGARVTGSVADVVSGSNRIGAIPKLTLTFGTLDLENGDRIAINSQYTMEGQSEKGRDTAKIVGGAAAGAVIGHQVDDDKGKIIGGLLGGAAGAIAAKKTGTEVQLAAGSTVTVTLSSGFRVGG